MKPKEDIISELELAKEYLVEEGMCIIAVQDAIDYISNLVEARVSLQTADLNKLLPYFIGLWAYQVYWEQRTEKEKTFCITLLINGKHVDTKDHINIKDAVIEAEKIIDDSRLSS